MAERSGLRDRLLALRDDLRHRLAMAEALDAGLLIVLADVERVAADLPQATAFDMGSLGGSGR